MVFYLVAGFLGVSFLLVPADDATSRVVLYILCQAVMSGDFYLVDTYTPDMFSTDTRNFAFSLLDAISKVRTPGGWGRLSTEVAFLLLTQQPRARIPAPPSFFSLLLSW